MVLGFTRLSVVCECGEVKREAAVLVLWKQSHHKNEDTKGAAIDSPPTIVLVCAAQRSIGHENHECFTRPPSAVCAMARGPGAACRALSTDSHRVGFYHG